MRFWLSVRRGRSLIVYGSRQLSTEIETNKVVDCIRFATTDDIPSILACNRRNLPEKYSIYYIQQHLRSWPSLSIVAVNDGGDLMGYALGVIRMRNLLPLNRIQSTGHVLSIAVEKTFRREGLGFRLMNALHTQLELKDPSLSCIDLYCRVSNTAAVRHYTEKHNYECAERLFSYYEDGEDAWIMKRRRREDIS